MSVIDIYKNDIFHEYNWQGIDIFDSLLHEGMSLWCGFIVNYGRTYSIMQPCW